MDVVIAFVFHRVNEPLDLLVTVRREQIRREDSQKAVYFLVALMFVFLVCSDLDLRLSRDKTKTRNVQI